MPKTYIETLINKEGGTVNIKHEAPHIIPKILTKQTGLANDIDFVGRKEELQKVDELLKQNAMLLLLNGIGGIGKSTLASYYLNQHKDKFDYYGFVQVNEDIKLSLASALSTSLDLKSEKIDDLFAEIMNKLHNLEGKKLLIIDDVKEMENQLDEIDTLMTLKNSGFQILFTSREVKENIPQYFLDIMSIEDARELFFKYHATDEMEKVDKILAYLDYHTLFIEMTAKTLTKRKRTLSLDQMIEKFANGEFASIKKNRNESFNQFLNDLFANDKVLQDEETLLFLKRLSVLPSIEISFEDLYRFLVCEDEERLEEFLNELVENGWLIESDGGYKFHQILKEFVFDSYLPEFVQIEGTLDYCLKLLDNYTDPQTALNNKGNLLFLDALWQTLEKIDESNEKVINFFDYFAVIYLHLGIYEKAEPLCLKALRIRKKTLGENEHNTATSYDNLGQCYQSMGMYKKVEPLLLKALNIREKISGEQNLQTATSYNNLGIFYQKIGDFKKAENFHLKAMRVKENILGVHHSETATSYNNLALFYYIMGIYEKSELFYLKALNIYEDIFGEQHLNTALLYANIAELYESIGVYKKAEQFHLKALQIRQIALGKEHPSTATSYNNLAELYRLIGKNEKAEPLYIKSLQICEDILGKEHIDTATSYNNLGLLYHSMGAYKKAESLFLTALKITKRVLGEKHQKIASSYNNLGEVYQEMGMYIKAEQFHLKALKTYEQVLGEQHASTASSYSNLGLFYQSIGKYKKAETLHLNALTVREKILGEQHTDTAISYNNLAVLYYEKREYQLSYEFIEKALIVWKKTLPQNHPNLIQAKDNLQVIKQQLIFNITQTESSRIKITPKLRRSKSKKNIAVKGKENASFNSVNNINYIP